MRRVGGLAHLAAASLLVLACGGAHDVPTGVRGTTPPVSPPLPAPPTLSLAQAQAIPSGCYAPGAKIASGPTVIVTDSKGVPASNVTVSFYVASGGGSVEHSLARSDNAGIATAGAWTVGDAAGVSIVHASLGTGPEVSFFALVAVPAKVIAVFRLDSVAGQPLPMFAPGWTITAGHYYLAENGTWELGYDAAPAVPPTTICSSAGYVRNANGIDFYLEPGSFPPSTFYQQRGGHFARATVSGTKMSVKYEDPADFDDEVYTLVAGSIPSSAARASRRPGR
jgi:hypothetical protein